MAQPRPSNPNSIYVSLASDRMVDVSQQRTQHITISYASLGGESGVHRIFIPWTNNYNVALESARVKLKRYFPEGTEDKFRWLALKTQDGSGWTELDADVFPAIAAELKDKAELRLDETRKPKNVTVIPLGHDEDTYYQFKIIVIGPSGVGKTMLLQCFTKPKSDWDETLEATTRLRMDISSRFITRDGVLLKAQLWDTAGSERYRSLTQSTYRNVNGVLLVYNLVDKDTFKECESWRQDLKKNIDNFDQVEVVLVGNQLDLEEQREVSTDKAQAYADRHRFTFAEVSAKEGTNVEQTFQTLMDAIFEKLSANNTLVQYKKSRNQQRPMEEPAPPRREGCQC
ncbi:elongation factor Tu GTP-binding domain protein [Rhizoctonia solani 123E]|uniref:Elongation factor Tu GTP-binding domain protein n=1 Tax=Rhizoctonia solani 123E TaxID=1423351 RepID=A0A074RLQ9_9AGAM|nr:elongation factor Tu GTP-binding domain protein [Rhizoctonia solani 123E]